MLSYFKILNFFLDYGKAALKPVPIRISLSSLFCSCFAAGLILPSTAWAKLPSVPEATTAAGNLLQMVFGLFAVIAVLGFLAWGIRRVAPSRLNRNGHLKIINGVSVGNRERVFLLEVDQQWIVIGVTQQSITPLYNMPRPVSIAVASAAPAASPELGFLSWLQRIATKNKTRDIHHDPVK